MKAETHMKTRIVLEGNAFYEIDEACMEKKQEAKKELERKYKDARPAGNSTTEHKEGSR
jgi:hypothetical protein